MTGAFLNGIEWFKQLIHVHAVDGTLLFDVFADCLIVFFLLSA